MCGSERRVERYYSFLEGFASVKDQSRVQAEEAQADHATTPMRDISSPDDYPAHVHKTFYKIMENYSRCCCGGLPAPPRQHEGRLRLRERSRINDNDVVFDTVFSRAPNRHPEAVEWQHLQFHICLYVITLLTGESSTSNTGNAPKKTPWLGKSEARSRSS